MNADSIWKLFCETGNVSCYLMYKEMARQGQSVESIQELRGSEQLQQYEQKS